LTSLNQIIVPRIVCLSPVNTARRAPLDGTPPHR
jgi:hypothetical protein